jgi:hypothetical protein
MGRREKFVSSKFDENQEEEEKKKFKEVELSSCWCITVGEACLNLI